MDIQNQLAAVEAANVTLDTENAQLRQALRAIRKGLSEDADGEFWPARRWLDARNIYHGDLSGNRVLELVAKHALHGKLDEPLAAFTPAEPPDTEVERLFRSRTPVAPAEPQTPEPDDEAMLNALDTLIKDGQKLKTSELVNRYVLHARGSDIEIVCGYWRMRLDALLSGDALAAELKTRTDGSAGQ